jgi:hypothetical protein
MFEAFAKDFFRFVETSLKQSEEVMVDLAQMVDEQMLEVQDLLERLMDPWVDEAQVQAVDEAMNAAAQPFLQTLYPMIDQHPMCVGCRHYHGQSYGNNFLVCGMYPYGYDGEKCPDWQSTWE